MPFVMNVIAIIVLFSFSLRRVDSFCTSETVRALSFRSLQQPKHLTTSPIIRHKNNWSGTSTQQFIHTGELSTVATKLSTILFKYEGGVPFPYALGMNIVLFLVGRSKLLSALTPQGYLHALALGTMLWTTLGWRGWSYCVLYLVLGQLVTKVRFQEKEKAGLAEGRGGRRGPENVWGSAATALACALATTVDGFGIFSHSLLRLGFCASLATKLADTFASEIGKAYGKTTFLITTFQRTEPGVEGAVSLEGTVAAAVGGLLLSLFGLAIGFIDGPAVVVSTLAAFVATNVESYLGATIQEGKFITNEVINFINTLIGAGIAMGAGKLILGM